MPEAEFPYALTGPEAEIVEVLRLAHMQAFSLNVTHRDGVFTVKLVDVAAGRLLEAHGSTLEEAWRALTPDDLLGMDLGLQDRIAARGLRVLDGGVQ